jgi:hypothetical protein
MLALNPAGDTLTERRYPYRPIRLTREAVDNAVRLPDARFRDRFPSEEAALEAIREALFIPPYHPPVSGIGRVETLPDVRIVHADRDRVWAVVQDEWEVPYVVRYRIAR